MGSPIMTSATFMTRDSKLSARAFKVISRFRADYVKVVGDTPVLSAAEM